MTCNSCEERVEKEIKKLFGIQTTIASYSAQQVIVEYDSEETSSDDIKTAIQKAGYSTVNKSSIRLGGIVLIAAAIIFLGNYAFGFDMEATLDGASYFVLFLVGLLTSIHCVGMCGGIMLSQSIAQESKTKFQAIFPSLKYNLGRIVSYTIVGGLVGALGSVLSISPITNALLQIFAAVFMIIMGLNMAGFSLFRFINIRFPKSFCASRNRGKAPFIVGLLNGLMPCGPLQTMQLYALGTGSAFKGALSMFLFSLGTVPLMLTFGAVTGILSNGFTKKLLKYSGVLVLILGIIMGFNGLTLTGIKIPSLKTLAQGSVSSKDISNLAKPEIIDGVQVIRMTAERRGYTPNVLLVQKNIPVKWIIEGKALNSCNNEIVVPSLDIERKLKSDAETIIEFTPGDADITFSCWMGMIGGLIKVTDNIETVDASELESIPAPSTGDSCCTTGAVGGETPAQVSIYGDDFSKVPTDSIIKKAVKAGTVQTAEVKGIGYEFDPMIIVAAKGVKSSISINLSDYDYYEGEFKVFYDRNPEALLSFEGKRGIVDITIDVKQSGTYWIVKDNAAAFAVEIVDDINKIDIEAIRSKYFNN
jgi:sulfite exporter TauE/SafE/plastocyanin domain-containing protein/copper chaperone CopZ